jgi:hypothetical protein
MKKLNFTFGKSTITATNSTKARFTIKELKEIFAKHNPTIYFCDCGAYYYFLDFAFNKGKKSYWVVSKHISGDFSKIEINIYE